MRDFGRACCAHAAVPNSPDDFQKMLRGRLNFALGFYFEDENENEDEEDQGGQ